MRDRICRLQPVADLRDLVTVIPMLEHRDTGSYLGIIASRWDYRITMGCRITRLLFLVKTAKNAPHLLESD